MSPPPGAPDGPRGRWLWWAGLAVAVLLAGGLSAFASTEPDGLERVSEDHGFAGHAVERAAAVAEGSTGKLLGLAVVLAVATALTWLLRRRSRVDLPSRH